MMAVLKIEERLRRLLTPGKEELEKRHREACDKVISLPKGSEEAREIAQRVREVQEQHG
ncbi:MAG: hypothetical protein KDC38_19990 [Planctomycetes bacterium]|nr:hypothetical protein [Planctomycetota bacterium]